MSIYLCPKKVFKTLVYIIVALGLINLGLTLFYMATRHGRLWGLGGLLNENAESNIPTWYSTFILLLAAVLAFVIATGKTRIKAPYAAHWKGMSFLMLYLSLDEGCMIHERIGDVFVRLAHGSQFAKMGWTAPFAVLAIVVAVLYIGFLKDLPAVTRRLFILAGAIYVGSGMILELLGGLSTTTLQHGGRIRLLLSTLEEPGEMLGIAVLIYALLAYIAEQNSAIQLTITPTDASTAHLNR